MLINKEARDALVKGVNQVANAVRVTLGPKGRFAAIYRGYGAPDITKDGVSVAREVIVDDPMMKIGAELIKEAAVKTNEIAGDGTTTATILAQAFINQGLKLEDVAPVHLKQAIDKSVKRAVDMLIERSYKINGNIDRIESVAKIAANNDAFIGSLIRQAVESVGEDGILLFAAGKNEESYIEKIEGMQFDTGYISPYFINKPETQEVEYEDALVLITDQKIENVQDLAPVFDYSMSENIPLIIVADDIETTCLSTILRNRLQNPNFKVAVIKMPGFGDYKAENLQDLALFSGGTVISPSIGLKLNRIKTEYFGKCSKVVLRKNKSIFIGGAGNPEDVKTHYENIRKQVPVESQYNAGKFAERLARLSGNVAIIRVGAATESELRERLDRVEDAVNAVKSALEYGVVDGGGVTLFRISKDLMFDKDPLTRIVATGIQEPFFQILKSCDADTHDIVSKIIDTHGYDAAAEKVVCMEDAGIFDTVSALKIALETAGSIAGSVLMTEVAINASGRNSAAAVPFG